MGNKLVGRFAPTPSGGLHLGNLFSFLIAFLLAKKSGGEILLRIEDLDPARTKLEYANAIMRDLEGFGFSWDKPPVFQSSRTEAYLDALTKLQAKGLTYPCFCSRADLHAANAPHFGEEYVYAGTCRNLTQQEIELKRAVRQPATRVMVDGASCSFNDVFQGSKTYRLEECSGDFIIRRSDGVFAYQLAVVVDDADMGVSSVVRGLDLLTSTPRQMYLQDVLGFTHPSYAHVPLLVDGLGRRLSKRDGDTDVHKLLNERKVPSEKILGSLAFAAGIIDEDEPCSLEELVREADLMKLAGKQSITAPEFI